MTRITRNAEIETEAAIIAQQQRQPKKTKINCKKWLISEGFSNRATKTTQKAYFYELIQCIRNVFVLRIHRLHLHRIRLESRHRHSSFVRFHVDFLNAAVDIFAISFGVASRVYTQRIFPYFFHFEILYLLFTAKDNKLISIYRNQ